MQLFPFLPPDEEPALLQIFTKSVFRSWCGIMTGGSIGVGILIYQVWGGVLYPVIFIFIGIIALFVVCSYVWSEERKDKLSIIAKNENEKISLREATEKLKIALTQNINQLETKVENLAIEKRPKLVGYFQDLLVSAGTIPDFFAYKEVSDELPPLEVEQLVGVTVTIRVGFVNESQAPTTIHNFSLTVKFPDGKTFTAKYPVSITRQIEKLKESGLPYDEKEDVKGINLDIYLDDNSKIAQKGNRIEGFLVFNFNDLSFSEWIDGTKMTLSVEDAFGENHLIVDWGMPPKPHQRIGFRPR